MTEIVSKSSDQTNGVLDMELLHIDVLEEEEEEEDVLQGAPEREHASFSKNVLRKQRHWERKLAARKSKRKEEKLRKKLNRHSEGVEQRHLTKRVLKAVTKERLAEARSGGHKVCVDLGVSHRMSDKMERTERSCLDIFPPERVVYLSPDAEEALERVDHDDVYVLGGLVDESVQKTLSLSRAKELGVRAARLPIDEHMQKMPNGKNFHSKILAINQVFDIMLTVSHTGSWTHALDKCFPRGKGYVVAQHGDNSDAGATIKT
ncbi:tRNA methyltransferase 10 homolog B isoform X3 [Phycodurus eques]|uniref:tRNA methyltransferase 10 homolog B isoform X3 n=1 Tax=Phycodurus eques TaxID=693459 RepID=UPI002ACEFB19|nr:tRNA methyltransferase 10 homolog B isoform X3 [Phycodurus eques]